ncbi:FUSC family protein [Demequina oxidasica]|uniref:FUSC family protein n=1 Tax=Demequina oxidasica TaxID=676199 RepID=UPI000B1DBDD5|nr:FUSC family protein [Demequina oxidasica]
MNHSAARERRERWTHGTHRAVKSLRTFQPYTGPRWPLGLQAALVMAVPIAVGSALGSETLGILAATGGFTVLHVTTLNVRERIRVLPLVAAFLLSVSVLATALAPYPLVASVGLVVVTIAGAALSFGYRMGAPGPLFVALTYGLSARVTSVVDGERAISPASLIVAVSAGMLFSLAVAAFPLVLARNRHLAARRLREILAVFALGRDGRTLLVRVAIVAVVGTLISVTAVDPERAYWTVGAGIAVVGTRAGRGDAARRGLHRIVGTVAGALIFLAFGTLDLAPLALAVVLGSLQFATQLVTVRNYALALLFITPMVLLLTGAATGTVGSVGTLTERVLDTAIGAMLGTLTGLLHRPHNS